ncbi:MAG: TonB-dependent receptor [Verrucomicrobia bacterium]|jgi:vitamin B12 transporter|nr:TonB-dependent receptor [Verrucomicrobiota bacterium]
MKKIVSFPATLATVLVASIPIRAVADSPGGKSATNQVENLPAILVVGTRIPTPPENTASPVTVITRDEILATQQRLVADVLRAETGVDIVRSGQPGGNTSLFLRGANSSHTLVLVDGIRMNNGFNNAFDFSQLAVDNIEQIEILRGPQSTLYGSEALGGVINIVTKRADGRPTGSVQTEYGSFNTWLTRGSFAVREGKASVSADASYAASDGDRINSDSDALNFSAHAGYDFCAKFRASVLATYLKSDAGAPNDRFTDDPNDRYKNENWLVGLTLEADPTPWWNAKLVLSHARERGTFLQPPPNPPFLFGNYASETIASRDQADFQNIFTPADGHKILVGGTFEDASADYTDNYNAFDRRVDTRSAYAQYEFTPHTRVTLTAGGRVDDSDAFGTHSTYRFGSRYTVPGAETILRASVGTGFRAPSIAQLYYPFYSNPNLKPEESLGWDVGFEQPLFGRDTLPTCPAPVRVGATFFHNDFDDLIAPSGFTIKNVSRARTFGIETFVSWMPLTNLTFRAAYTWLDAEDLTTGDRLMRRPEHRGNFSANWGFLPGLCANLNLAVVGERSDSYFDNTTFASTKVRVPGYTKLDLALRWQATKHLELYARAENLLDEDYEEVFGFPALGRFLGAGVIARF